MKYGIVTITGKGDAPFLGVGAGIEGPVKVSFRVRTSRGGTGKAEWIPSGGNAQSVQNRFVTRTGLLTMRAPLAATRLKEFERWGN